MGGALPRIHNLILGLLLLTGPAACRPDSSEPDRQSTGFIALVGAGRSDPLWPILQASAEEFQKNQLRVEIRVEAPAVVSPNLQGQLIRQLRDQGLRGLCVQVIDPRAAARLLESLRSRGVVVVTMMRRIESPDPFLHCGIDPWKEGASLAQALAERIPDRGTVGVIYDDSDETRRLRRAGFNRQFAQHAGLTVLRELDCRGDAVAAVRSMREAMERFPGIDGWAAMDTWPLEGANDGAPLLPEGCVLVLPGLAADPVGVIRSGRCQALVLAKDYRQIVRRALEMCLLSLDRQLVRRRVFEARTEIVTRQTVDQFERDWAAWTGAVSEPPAGPGGAP